MAEATATVTVLAGTNGAGKSSIAGALLSAVEAPFYNPDVETQALLAANPDLPLAAANAEAWRIGKERLQTAIAERHNFNFETTLGGSTIPRLLAQAHQAGLRVRVWYCGLASAELHIRRVRVRVSQGGHDIPEAKIRERFAASRHNLCTLLPSLTELVMYDNSTEADLQGGHPPQPTKLLHYLEHKVLYLAPLMPEWAKPIAAVALNQLR